MSNLVLRVLKAKQGDCLIIEGDGARILVDGGPRNVYSETLKAVIDQLPGRDDQPPVIDLLMVSHIDSDHIGGVLKLTEDLIRHRESGKPAPARIAEAWHNSFSDLVGNSPKSRSAQASPAEIEDAISDLASQFAVSQSALASVAEGRQLRDNLEKLSIRTNRGFRDGLVLQRDGAAYVSKGGRLSINVIGPTRQELDRLRSKWSEELPAILARNAGARPASMNELDETITNLASIVCIVEMGGRRILLTGDAHGDQIVRWLGETGYLIDGKVHFDIVKMPHHGSSGNAPDRFFETIAADHYVVSGNGSSGNPESAMLERLLAQRHDGRFKVHMTYSLDDMSKADKFRAESRDSLQTLLAADEGRDIFHFVRPGDDDLQIDLQSGFERATPLTQAALTGAGSADWPVQGGMTSEQFINHLIYETSGNIRFTQDTPILPNIWFAYATTPRSQQELILSVGFSQSAGAVANVLRKKLFEYRKRVEESGMVRNLTRLPARISYIPGQIAAKLYFDELICVVLPLTSWWVETSREILERRARRLKREQDRALARTSGGVEASTRNDNAEPDQAVLVSWLKDPSIRNALKQQVWKTADQSPAHKAEGDNPSISIPPDFVWLVRIAGLIAYYFLNNGKPLEDDASGERDVLGEKFAHDIFNKRPTNIETSYDRRLRTSERLDRLTAQDVETIIERFETFVEQGEVQADSAYIFRINRNRRVQLAVSESALTVKADAARRVFDVDTSNITWAVIDSGIDRYLPAFRDTSDKHATAVKPQDHAAAIATDPEEDPWLAKLCSRVVMTLDFTHLRELVEVDLSQDLNAERLADVRDQDERVVERMARNIAARREIRYKGDTKGFDLREPPASTAADIAEARRRYHEFKDHLDDGRTKNWHDMQDMIRELKPERPENDHGTHVAGILGADWIDDIAAERSQLPSRRTRKVVGICPEVRIIDVRVFRADGLTDEFELMAAIQYLQWMNSSAGYMKVHGANLSVSLVHQVKWYACGQTPICIECDKASAGGMLIVAAAGNRGFDFDDPAEVRMSDTYRSVSITDPGNAASVVTVGATHRRRPHEYGVSYFSSRGPTGDGRSKPDVVAPGEKIEAPILDGEMGVKDGTSMAAPHVSGIGAMLMARHSELIGNPARVKKIICDTATDLGRERYFQGHGLVDALRALQSV